MALGALLQGCFPFLHEEVQRFLYGGLTLEFFPLLEVNFCGEAQNEGQEDETFPSFCPLDGDVQWRGDLLGRATWELHHNPSPSLVLPHISSIPQFFSSTTEQE